MAAGIPASDISDRRWSLTGALLRGCGLGLFLTVAGEIANHLLLNNVHVVIPGAVYRCAQPSSSDLERLVRTYGIRTVVNLRGFGDSQAWYREECRGANRLNLSLESVGFSAGRLPPADELKHLIEVLDRSTYPIAFHCYRGVDRTGMACTIALLLRTDLTPAKARRAMSLRHLHLPWGRTGNLDRFFNLYEEWLQERGRSHSPDAFRHWAKCVYSAGPCRCRLELLGPVLVGPRQLPAGEELPARQASAFPGEPPPRRLRVPPYRPFSLRVRCRNTSRKTWRLNPAGNAGIHACWLIKDNRDRYLCEGRAGLFRAEVQPGSFIDLTLCLPSLPPGIYSLQLDMIEEQHCPFRQTGSPPLDLEVVVS